MGRTGSNGWFTGRECSFTNPGISTQKTGKEISEEERKDILDKILKDYNKQTQPTYAAARLWTDAIINPIDTRKWISMGIEAANHSPITEKFNLGVIQV
jgi:acetyl-CoA carboxylase carboxyltransferase component